MNLISIPCDGRVTLTGVTLSETAASVIVSTQQVYERSGYVEPWVGYLAIEGSNCVGCCGFTSPPTEGAVEIAYFTFPEFEGRGIATGMVQRLVSISRECDPSVKIVAHTLTEENASTHILKKLGFALAATIDHPEDGRIWEWMKTG